jgi:hypothetical protein
MDGYLASSQYFVAGVVVDIQGGAFSASTGQLTAPDDALYVFLATGELGRHFELVVDSTVIAHIESYFVKAVRVKCEV